MKTETEKEAGSFILRNYGQFFKKQYQDFVYLSGPTHRQLMEENKTFTPIQVIMSPRESTSVTALVTSDNTVMTKVLSVLSSLCVEVTSLKAEGFERHFPFLAAYDEYSGNVISSPQMESICQLSAFISRCSDTLVNLCSQVFAIVNEGLINLNGIQWHYIIKNIGEAFTILVLLEQLIASTLLASNWNKYDKSLRTSTSESFDLYDAKLKSLMGAIDAITQKMMNDDIVQNCLHTLLTIRKKDLTGKNLSLISSEFTNYIKHAISNLDKLVHERANIKNMYKTIKINALYVLSSHLFGSSDKKIFKILIDLNTKAHSIPIMGTVIWFPEQFLQRHISSQCANYSKLSQTMLKARQAYMSCKKNSLNKDIMNLKSICSHWVLDVEEMFSSSNKLSAAEMSHHAKTILDGLDAASSINFSIVTFINLHVSLGIPLSKSTLIALFDVIDVLKSLSNAVSRNYEQILISNTMITQHLIFQASSSILEVKKTLMCDKKYANKRLDELTCIVIAEQAINGPATSERNVAANVALSFVPEATYLEDTYSKLGMLLEKVEILTNFSKSMKQYCNCSWMLWHQNIFTIYLEQNFSNHINALRIKYFIMMLEDCAVLLHKTDKQFGQDKLSEFTQKITNMIDANMLNDLSQNIETNLRLHIHSHLQLDVINPLAFDMIKKILLAIDVFRIQLLYLSVVPFVEHYLSKTYYNLTTVVLSDWKTYGEMRQMAKFKFNISTIEDNLPTQTLENGLDVLEIMRNIHVFVAKYQYNLNNQIFIEKSSSNKHLNTINILHIANSIRTNGTGVMNTTVNFTYQFLKNKFYTFSQFMYDEQIKSRLIKDMRNFKENAGTHGNMYPYKNAERFNKGIKVLGLDEDGQSYLDLFRDLISQIGNAIGYVRMIRSGGRHCCADATAFLPNLENGKILQAADENILGNKVIESAENFDENVDGLISNFIQGTEYFKLLVDVFAPVFRNPKNIHLKNFYIIVPPLTLNFVEHMILSKDKMYKKNKIGASFTDDGFAMGIAYILKLLDQDSNFESLDWFQSVWNHIKIENQMIEQQKSKGSVQLQQALALTEKKIKTLEEEYKLLYYSLTSARIFFR